MSEERILNLLNNKKYIEAKKLISNLMRIEKKIQNIIFIMALFWLMKKNSKMQ